MKLVGEPIQQVNAVEDDVRLVARQNGVPSLRWHCGQVTMPVQRDKGRQLSEVSTCNIQCTGNVECNYSAASGRVTGVAS